MRITETKLKKETNLPVQQTSEFVTHIDKHDLFASTRELDDLTLYGFGHVAVDGTTETTVRWHTNDQVLVLVFRSLELSLLV